MKPSQLLSLSFRLLHQSSQSRFVRGLRECRDENDVKGYLDHEIWKHANFSITFDEFWDQVRREAEIIEEKNIVITHPTASDYPSALKSVKKAPLYLSYMGQPTWLDTPLISVVGSRQPTREALEWMNIYLPDIVKHGIGVVSGAARGVDQRAHRICLHSRKPTVAFLPSGLLNLYPSQFRDWVEPILEHGGCLVSEYTPHAEVTRYYFHERNRLICGLGRLLLVVQARVKSGSLMTAQHAIDLGQTVVAVPWDPFSVEGFGTNKLLAEGANLVRDSADLKILWSMSSPYAANSIETQCEEGEGDTPDTDPRGHRTLAGQSFTQNKEGPIEDDDTDAIDEST